MLVSFEELKGDMKRVMMLHGFSDERAELCASVFAGNSRDGVHSHGLNRFPTFMDYVQQGLIQVNAEPEVVGRHGNIEKWDGRLAPGVYTATLAMRRAVELAKENGIACVAVRNTNHWMRGGTYGWQAAEGGCIAICGTNAIANMPPYGGKQPTLGNNPLVIAVPRRQGHLVIDMAMSQFSYGKLNEYKMKGSRLPVPGGYDEEGKITQDPSAIITTQRTLPVGYWKGSGLAMMVDVLVSALSGGRSVKEITEGGSETGVSQFFICISPGEIDERIVEGIIEYSKRSEAVEGGSVRYPGEQTLAQRRRSEEEGIEVNETIWEKVRGM